MVKSRRNGGEGGMVRSKKKGERKRRKEKIGNTVVNGG